MLVEVGALISWCIYTYRIVMLLVPYMWASMTFLPCSLSGHATTNWQKIIKRVNERRIQAGIVLPSDQSF